MSANADDFDPQALVPPLRVPVLANGPIVLRPFAPSDLDLVRQASADPRITTISSVPHRSSKEAARAFIERQRKNAEEGNGFSFVIASGARGGDGLRDGGGPGVGSIALWLREIESGRAAIGYWLLASARGHRLAGQALRALVGFAFDELAIPRLHLFVEPWNVASARTARSAGFRHEGLLQAWERIDGAQRDLDCYALLRRDRMRRD